MTGGTMSSAASENCNQCVLDAVYNASTEASSLQKSRAVVGSGSNKYTTHVNLLCQYLNVPEGASAEGSHILNTGPSVEAPDFGEESFNLTDSHGTALRREYDEHWTKPQNQEDKDEDEDEDEDENENENKWKIVCGGGPSDPNAGLSDSILGQFYQSLSALPEKFQELPVPRFRFF